MKLLSTVILILAIILFPPATLALVSNDAVPGDATYSIKRFLEDGIYTVASLNSVSKAWFSAARSDRRFKELSTLILQGKSASNSLNELVAQTDIAAEEIKKVEDPVKKQQLITQLSQSIDKYSQKLDEINSPQIAVITPTNTPMPEVTQIPSAANPPSETVKPTKIPTPTAKSPSSPRPTELPRPSPSQTTISSQPPGTVTINPGEADDAKKKFEDIKKKLEEENKKSHEEKSKNKGEEKQDNRSDNSDISKESKVQPKGKDK